MSSYLNALQRHQQLFEKMTECEAVLTQLSEQIDECLKDGGKLLFIGNGGSAADSQHLATEFVVRYKAERAPLAAIALTTDTSLLTAHANDYSYDTVFSRQVAALARPGDILIGISTSGNSKNIIDAVQIAQEMGVQGRVNVMFVIQKDGSIGNVRMRGPSKILEMEAARIIGELPKMKPGKHKNENVKVPFAVPIVFKLNDTSSNTNEAKANLDAMWVVATSTNKNGKRYLSGKVTNGELGLPGVNIIVKGENKGAVTNFDGEFTIEVKSGNVLNFQHTGFPKTALVITDKEEYKIKSIKE